MNSGESKPKKLRLIPGGGDELKNFLLEMEKAKKRGDFDIANARPVTPEEAAAGAEMIRGIKKRLTTQMERQKPAVYALMTGIEEGGPLHEEYTKLLQESGYDPESEKFSEEQSRLSLGLFAQLISHVISQSLIGGMMKLPSVEAHLHSSPLQRIRQKQSNERLLNSIQEEHGTEYPRLIKAVTQAINEPGKRPRGLS